MGVYIFNTDILVRRLIDDMKQDTEHDFGKNIIPDMVTGDDRVYAYPFVDENKGPDVYWRDIGTIASYYDANMDLTQVQPQFNLYDDEWPIHRRNQPGPPGKTISYGANFTEAGPPRPALVEDTLLATGVIISGAQVQRSILGPRCFLHSWAQVQDSILFDDVEIGRHCRIQNAIIDKHVKLPPGTVIGEDPDEDRQRFTVSPGGIVVLPSGIILK